MVPAGMLVYDADRLDTFRNALLNGTSFGRVAIQILSGQEFYDNAGRELT